MNRKQMMSQDDWERTRIAEERADLLAQSAANRRTIERLNTLGAAAQHAGAVFTARTQQLRHAEATGHPGAIESARAQLEHSRAALTKATDTLHDAVQASKATRS